MNKDIVVEAQERSDLGKNASRRLRKDGGVPGVVYGLDRPPFTVGIGARRIEEVLQPGNRAQHDLHDGPQAGRTARARS